MVTANISLQIEIRKVSFMCHAVCVLKMYTFNLCADIERQEGSQNCSSGRKKSWQRVQTDILVLIHTHTRTPLHRKRKRKYAQFLNKTVSAAKTKRELKRQNRNFSLSFSFLQLSSEMAEVFLTVWVRLKCFFVLSAFLISNRICRMESKS